MRAGEGSVRLGKLRERVLAVRQGGLEACSDLLKPIVDERDLDGRLVGKVLVERGGTNADSITQPSHGETIRSITFQDLTSGGDDCPRPRTQTGSFSRKESVH